MPATTISTNSVPQGYGSAALSMDLTEVYKLAADLFYTGMITKNLQNAAFKGIDRGSRHVLRRLKANVNKNDSHIEKFGTITNGVPYHPYSRTRPMPGSLGHDPRLVHRLTQNMNQTASIEGPIIDFNKTVFSEIGWDSSSDGRYIRYVVEGTVKMVPRDILGLTAEETEQKVIESFLSELNMNQIFSVSGNTLMFGGIYPVP